MKCIRYIFLAMCFYSPSLLANPVGEVRLVVKILSFDSNWVNVELKGSKSKTRVPRSALNGVQIASGEEREIGLTQNHYNLIRLLNTQPGTTIE